VCRDPRYIDCVNGVSKVAPRAPLNLPDKIRATRKGGFADVEIVLDGKMLTMLGKPA